MSLYIEITGSDAYNRWDEYVRQSSLANLFHSTGWKQVVEKTYGFSGVYLAVHDKNKICGILPLFLCGSRLLGRSLVALPFIATQPSVCADNGESEQLLVDAAVNLSRQYSVQHLELREDSKKHWDLTLHQPYVNACLKLSPDPNEVWQTRVESRVRTKVRKAQRSGLTILWSGHESVDDFYKLYAHAMHRLGSPPHSKKLFSNIFLAFPSQTEIVLVMDKQRPIAGALVMHDNKWIGFPWAASLVDSHSMHPNNLLYWSIIEYACKKGFSVLDLGRSPRQSGTMHFKKQWGAEIRPLYYYFGLIRTSHMPVRDASNPIMVTASHFWRRLPELMSTWLGPRLARLIP